MNKNYTNNSEPLTKHEFLQTMKGNIVTSEMLDREYNMYLVSHYGYCL
jgi:hypothetical protein